ncbi:condensation domain-containing protein, partial [Streptomyces sp. ICBB 8177]|uniref:condensation domain-containing protein n=1 Tax=Streptomyces sp. ICBB 8177 TaxID=563922 RepID=UPI001F5417AF
VAQVGMDDDFFRLGGHSLLATRLVSRARTALDVELEVRTLFRHPTVAKLAAALDSVDSARPPLSREARPEALPSSYAQQRLWFLGRLEGPNATYNIPLVLRLDGDLDTGALQAALTDVVVRHESLRTVFVARDGEPFQCVLGEDRAGELARIRCEAAPAGADAEAAERWAQESVRDAAAEPFDLDHDPAVKVRLLRLDARTHVLVLTLHHIAADGWSLAPLARDLGTAYRARVADRTPDWEPLPVQYADYTLWQRRTLGEPDRPESLVSRQLGFWRDALAGMPEAVDLPLDHPRPAAPTHAGGTVPFRLSPEAHREVTTLARARGCTVFMVLQGALAVLLARHGAGEDIPLGTAVAGRADEALDDLIGFFVNTLVLRTDLSGDPTFSELLDRVRDFDLGAYANADLPFERLVEELNPVRSRDGHPLFQVMLVLQNQAAALADLPGLTVTERAVHTGVSKFDLTFSLTETHDEAGRPAGVEGYVEFASDIFTPETARTLSDRLARLLGSLAADPGQRVGEVPVLTAEERAWALDAGRGEVRAVPEGTLPELFDAQAARTPDAPAVRDATGVLTYRQLLGRADGLARLLRERGVRRGDLVALSAPRAAAMVIAMLGVVKAGAAYMPVDPDYPAARITSLLDDARPRVLLTSDGVRERLPATDVPVVTLDEVCADGEPDVTTDADRPDGTADVGTHAALSACDPAYVIYTSGSTGKPKGVVISHGAAVHHMAWMADHL